MFLTRHVLTKLVSEARLLPSGMEISDMKPALLTHAPVPDDAAVAWVSVGAMVSVAVAVIVAVLVGDKVVGGSVNNIVLTTGVAVVSMVTSDAVSGNEQADITMMMDRMMTVNFKFFISFSSQYDFNKVDDGRITRMFPEQLNSFFVLLSELRRICRAIAG